MSAHNSDSQIPRGMHPDKWALLHDPNGHAVHFWFDLTYANYLVLPRSLMQSMPGDWQRRMVECLEEIDKHFEELPTAYSYRVQAVDESGRFTKDPVPHYERGRTFVPRPDPRATT